jgi:hypothetical protein
VGLSNHLTSLNLSLAELLVCPLFSSCLLSYEPIASPLRFYRKAITKDKRNTIRSRADGQYRIPYLPETLRQACFYCSKYLKMPDGLPVQHTGYLTLSGGRSSGSDGPDGDGERIDGSAGGPDEARGEGRWVCWHDSCGEQ